MWRPVLRGRVILAATACLLVSIRSGAAGPVDQAIRAVTLVEAVASADRAPQMTAARAGEQAAEAGVRVARALPDPEVSMTTNSINVRESRSEERRVGEECRSRWSAC